MNNRVVLITGATGALASHVAPLFAAAGARLALAGRRPRALAEAAQAVPIPAERLLTHVADLSDAAQARALVEAVLAAWGRVDCLLNLTGGWSGGVPLAEMTDAHWDEMIEMNLRTAFHIARAVLPVMVAQGEGRIVNIASQAVERTGVRQAAYNVAKSGVVALTRSIAADYGAAGIRANVLLPGSIDREAGRNRPDRVPPEALAQTMLLLCGPAGRAINGAAIPFYTS